MPTYGEVRTKFKDRLKRRDCTDALADGFLQDSVKRIQRNMRVPAGEKSVQIVVDGITLPDGKFPIPSDYLQLKDITVNDKVVLTRAPLAQVLWERAFGAAGTTRHYAREGAAWVFGPPLAGDTLRVDYYTEFEPASAPADETLLLDIADDLIIYGALSYACDHWSDKRGPGFEQRFVQILSDIEAQGDDDELTGNAQVAQAFCYNDYV